MTLQGNAESLLFFAAAAISAAIVRVGWSRRPHPLVLPFAAMMSGQAAWAFFEGLELILPDLGAKKVCFALRAGGAVVTIQGLLIFVLRDTRRGRWLSGPRLIAMLAPHVVLLPLAWTNEWHRLYWSDLRNESIGGFAVAVPSYGPAWQAHLVYCYAQAAVSTALLMQAVAASTGPARARAVVMLLGVLAPWTVNALDLSRVLGFIHLDTAALAFIPTGLAFLVALGRSRPRRIVPMARDAVFEEIGDAVLVLDDLGRIADLNPAAVNLLGRDDGDGPAVGRDADEVLAGWPDLRARLGSSDSWTFEVGGPARAPDLAFEGRVTRLGEGDDADGWVLVLRDVTERRRSEAEHARLLEEQSARSRAEADSRAKDRVLATLSHELRTPLSPALAGIVELIEDPRTPPRVRDVLAVVRRGVELEARLIDDLLDVSRIAHGKLRVSPVVLDAHEVVREALRICDADLRGAGLVVAVELLAESPHIRGDGPRLLQVVWNLLKNAAKFTPRGGRLVVRSQNREGEGSWELEVSDSGIGIDPAFLPRIFEPFMQAEESPRSGRPGGLGLGLAICRGLVEAQGGRLAASSEGPGRGATFTVTLPCVPSPSEAPEAAGAWPPTAPVAVATRRRVLLVEDDDDTRRMLARFLRRQGLSVADAGGVVAALELAAGAEFDVLICDLGLPDGNGHDLLGALRARSDRPLRAIALTGLGGEDDLRESHDRGFFEHLTKPVDPGLLLEAIRGADGAAVRG